jgi:peptide chain release factor 2/peptide chain release factor
MSPGAPRAGLGRQVLTISSGLGPIEARSFVAALAHELEGALVRAGARVVERRLTSASRAASVRAPPRSIDLVFEGGDASGWVGTHALVEPSERRARRTRKRWFVGVTLRTESALGGPTRVAVADLEISFCRARGPGGQHVNRTESAVRVRHRPSGVVVRVEEERARGQNLARAV